MTHTRSGDGRKTGPAGGAPDRRSMLKWAMLGGGAAVAGLFRGPIADAAIAPKEQETQAAVDRATRGMPAPRITVIQGTG